MNRAPEREKRENGADAVSEEISQTDEEHKATHSKKPRTSQTVNTDKKEKNIHWHILVKLKQSRGVLFFFSHGAPFLKGTTVRMLTDFYTEMMADWGRWKDNRKVQK